MKTGTKAGFVSRWKAEAERIASEIATEELYKEFGEEFAVNHPEEFYQKFNELVERYTALILAKKVERLPIRLKGRGRKSKTAKAVQEFFKRYEKALKDMEKPKKVRYVVYSWIAVKNPAFKEKAIIPTYLGSYTDKETALAVAREHGGFIIETQESNPYIAFLREVKEIYQKSTEKVNKAIIKKLIVLGEKYGLRRFVWTIFKHIDDYYLIYAPDMPITLKPEFAKKVERILLREYGNRRALNDKYTVIATAVKIRRANVPILAVKVRKSELTALKRTIGKPLSINAIRRNAF